MRRHKLLKYGLIAGVAYLAYEAYRKSQAPAVAVTPAVAAPTTTPVAGLAYFPDGSDRIFAPRSTPGRYWRNWQ